MKASIFLGAVAALLGVACSSEPGSGGGGPNGSGASSSTGATSTTGATSSTGTGAGPMLEVPMAGSTGTGGSSPVDNGQCAQQSVVIGAKPADVLLVLDRSKSMIENYVPPNDDTRWDAVVPALNTVLQETDASVSWGLKVFPEGEGKECIAAGVTDAVSVPIAPKNAAAVSASITATTALGNGTPTGEAIKKATTYLKGRGAANQFILLATDGDPSCPDGDDEAETYAVSAITEAKAAGFPVYVVGVLDPVKDKSKFPTLNAMAEAGGTSRSDSPGADKFYQAYSQEELTNALKAVTGQVVSCVFELTSKPPVPDNIAVSVNGDWLTQDTTKAQGWDYTSDQFVALELHGAACEALKTSAQNKVDIIFGCPGTPIDIPK